MAVYECDFCQQLRDDDEYPPSPTPNTLYARKVLDGCGLICDLCQGAYDDQIEAAAEARRYLSKDD